MATVVYNQERERVVRFAIRLAKLPAKLIDPPGQSLFRFGGRNQPSFSFVPVFRLEDFLESFNLFEDTKIIVLEAQKQHTDS